MQKRGLIFKYKAKKKGNSQSKSLSMNWGMALLFMTVAVPVYFSMNNQTAGTKPGENYKILSFLAGPTQIPTPTVIPSPTPTATPTPTPVILPSRLIIARIGVDAHIENLGIDQNGNMGIPARWEDVGWYELGARPGEAGNGVIAGHLDTDRGAPAAFYRLSQLVEGDTVEVINTDGNVLTFRVTGKEIYPYDQVPKEY